MRAGEHRRVFRRQISDEAGEVVRLVPPWGTVPEGGSYADEGELLGGEPVPTAVQRHLLEVPVAQRHPERRRAIAGALVSHGHG